MTLDQIEALVSAVETFPLDDIQTLLANPDPASAVQIVEDVAQIIAAAYPDAEVAALAFEVVVWALRNPAINADTNKDPLGRGGRRS